MSHQLKILKELQRLLKEESLPVEFCEKINLEQRLFNKIVFVFDEDSLKFGFIIDSGYDGLDMKTFHYERIIDFLLENNHSFFSFLFDDNFKYSKEELKIIFKNMQ